MSNLYYALQTWTKNTLARAENNQSLSAAIVAAFDKVPAQLDLEKGLVGYKATAGAADVYTVTSTYPIVAYTEGHHARLKIHATNTGASTVNFDTLGAKSIKLPDGSNPAAGDLLLDAILDITYDGTNYKMNTVLSSATAAAASATAAAADAVSTAADVVSTNADVVSTNADVVTAAASAEAAANSAKTVLMIAVSDETTAITTGTAKVTFRMPFALTLTAVRASLGTVSSSGIPTVDINEGGSTILSTKLTIDASEKTSTTAAAAAVISDTALADAAEITIDIDVAGTGAKGLKVYLIGDPA